MTIDVFLSHWESKSTAHIIDKHIRIHGNLEVSLYKSGRGNNIIRLSSIRSTKQRKGDASKFLKWLNNQADKHGFDITTGVEPFSWNNDDSMNKDKLKAWFEKYGYSIREKYPEDWAYEMVRKTGSKGKK